MWAHRPARIRGGTCPFLTNARYLAEYVDAANAAEGAISAACGSLRESSGFLCQLNSEREGKVCCLQEMFCRCGIITIVIPPLARHVPAMEEGRGEGVLLSCKQSFGLWKWALHQNWTRCNVSSALGILWGVSRLVLGQPKRAAQEGAAVQRWRGSTQVLGAALWSSVSFAECT